MAGTLTIGGSVGGPIGYQIDNFYWDNGTTNDAWNNGTWVGDWSDHFASPKTEVHIHSTLKKEEVKDMRGLFHVVVVEYKIDEILEDRLVIAKNAETAKIKALAPLADEYDLDDLDVTCNRLGDVRKKKEVQKVEIVESK